ncbi:MAG: hypothetical protein JNL70_11890 [Saprospiraceae bacterium]|nr:hypothetical protein [Saprospiraceae bacterium]
MNLKLKTRIAPTPSGLLHEGNGASFLLTYAFAKAYEGDILLRIDDLDADRMRLEYLDDIFKTLDWLGIEWTEGPSSVADFQQNWSQHRRLHIYNYMLNLLKNQKDLLYACECSRKQIKETTVNGFYPQTCRFKNLDFNQMDTAWRIHVPDNNTVSFSDLDLKTKTIQQTAFFSHCAMGDFVVRQKNRLPAYQIASVADDAYFGVNFVVRGADLLQSTVAQIYITQQLKRTDFSKTLFIHHDLVKTKEGDKLSKSKDATALAEWRYAGKTPENLIKQAAKWLNLPEVGNFNELIAVLKASDLFNIPPQYFSKKV